MSGGKSSLCPPRPSHPSPRSWDQSQPSRPPPPTQGAEDSMPSTWNGRALSRQAQGLAVAGVGGELPCPCPSPPHLVLPLLIYHPLETKIFFFLTYNLRLGSPVLSSPLTRVSCLTDGCLLRMVCQGCLPFIT
uniref:Uncharacterized protein n=1 Tax=Rousettus aegyptiacus TaxID=9407 RepID=A0A7J8H126_ROUAE|nr:hypothetical protein HJG63_011187 [Rousettus aegyptiacus]